AITRPEFDRLSPAKRAADMRAGHVGAWMVRARSGRYDTENLRQVILKRIKLWERLREAVLQVEVRLQLARNVVLRWVLKVCKFLPELCFSALQLLQQP